MPIFVAMMVLLVAVLFVSIRFALHKRKLQRQTWDGVLSRVEPLDVAGLRAIADLYLLPGKDQLSIQPNDMWKTLGGQKGLHLLCKNADAMLMLAMFAEQWHSDDGRVVSEFMRRDALRLKKAVSLVEMSVVFGFGTVKAPFALHEAIASYMLMRGRLLGLYRVAHVARIPLLEAAL